MEALREIDIQRFSDPSIYWPEWTDVVGNKFGPGDYVAYASISGKSPQLVIAQVERINRYNSYKQLIVPRYGKNAGQPSCTVTVYPIIDARGFYRSKGRQARSVTLQLPENIIKIDWTPPEEKEAP